MDRRCLTVGLLGLTFDSNNLGCSALAYAFLRILKKAAAHAERRIRLVAFYTQFAESKEYVDDTIVCIETFEFALRKPKEAIGLIRAIRSCDYVFDFTSGDSFTDLYGDERFKRDIRYKRIVQASGTPLILGPQTYGPFSDVGIRNQAAKVISKALIVYARDKKSALLASSLGGIEVRTICDVAIGLPGEPFGNHKNATLKAGINVSGLLWYGGYTQNNQFCLRVEYQQYVRKLIESLIGLDNAPEIHLIPHVIFVEGKNLENDLEVCDLLQKEYPCCSVARDFKNPMQAKGYISQLDFFTGARMHATIAALSSCVPVVPFGYSKKFEDLYQLLEYDHVVDGRTCSTDEAVEATMQGFLQRETLKRECRQAMTIADGMLTEFISDISGILRKIGC